MFDTSFWKDFLSNFFATLIGAFLGFYLSIKQQKDAEKREKSNDDLLAKQRKKKIIETLKSELNYNRSLFATFKPHFYTEDTFGSFYDVASKGNF